MENLEYHQHLHNQALEISSRYLTSEKDLIEILTKIDKCRAYLTLKYPNLHDYAVEALRLSNDVAYYFIRVARVSVKVPELKCALDLGEITVSQARRVASVISKENAQELINKAQNLSQREFEREVAKINPKASVPDKLKYLSESRLEFRCSISEEIMKKVRRVQDLESQRTKTTCDFESLLDKALTEYLKVHDPIEKAERAENRKKKQSSVEKSQEDLTQSKMASSDKSTISISAIPSRKPIRASTTHHVNLRDQAQCTYIDHNQKRCQRRRWLHVHHKQEVSNGGTNDLANLTTLCFGHHKMIHLSGGYSEGH